jgi:hypothetical protein
MKRTGLLLVFVLLAGCASSTAKVGPGSSGGPLVTDETGAILGTVLTEELLPIRIGTVTLFQQGAATSNETIPIDSEGAFSFGTLAPGPYGVVVTVEGFYPVEKAATVAAGETTNLHVVLTARPAREPYVMVSSWAGFNPCGLALIVTPANMCDGSESAVTNITGGGAAKTSRNYTIPDGFAAIVGETTWKGGDQASAYYYNGSQESKNSNESSGIFSAVLDVAQGSNPLRVYLLPDHQRENATQGVLASYYGKVSDRANFTLRYAVWWNGYFGDNFAAANPVCNQFAVPKCAGVGATPAFRFTHWMSIFMYDAPADIKSYTILPDE